MYHNNETDLTIDDILNEVKSFLTTDKEKYLAFKYYHMILNLLNDPDSEEQLIKIEDYIDEQIDKVEETIDQYESMDVHPDVIDVHNDLLEAFESYHEGLDKLEEFFETENPDDLSVAFEHIIDADELFIKIEKCSEKYAKENPIITLI